MSVKNITISATPFLLLFDATYELAGVLSHQTAYFTALKSSVTHFPGVSQLTFYLFCNFGICTYQYRKYA